MAAPLPWLDEEDLWFPDPATALAEPNGLLAVGGDLRPERLLQAYQRGIFPWFEEDQPPLWWSPDPRMVLFPAELHVSRSMRKVLRQHPYRICSDHDFAGVMRACAGARHGSTGTWISPAMVQAYGQLYQLGHAHSVEVWENDTLVGGLYGIAMGQVFFGESMFSLRPNTSKLALCDLAARLPGAGFRIIDCQVANPHLATLGARNISRSEFRRWLPAPGDIGGHAAWPYNSSSSPE
ncbi:MAG: leucyl/phenylalanyl-tRNA--protein transferase [Pseudohongiellaceae bacterium]